MIRVSQPREVAWTGADQELFQQFLETDTGRRILQKWISDSPSAGDSNRISADHQLGRLSGFEDAVSALFFLSRPESSAEFEKASGASAQSAPPSYPDLDVDGPEWGAELRLAAKQ
jgi:hypothetical protein